MTEEYTTIACSHQTKDRFNKARIGTKMNQDEFLTLLMDKAKVKPLEEVSVLVDKSKRKVKKK